MLTISYVGAQTQPAPTTMTREARWHEDLKALAELAEKAKPFQDQSAKRQAFERAIAQLDADVSHKSEEQMLTAVMRAVAMAEDSHTSVNFARYRVHWFPFQVYWFQEGFYITDVTKGHEELLGARLMKINGQPAERVAKKLSDLIAHENDSVFRAFVPWHLTCAQILEGLGITKESQAAFTFRLANGQTAERMLEPTSDHNWISFHGGGERRYAKPELNYWFEPLAAEDAVYFQYRHCSPMGRVLSRSSSSSCSRRSTRNIRRG